MTSYEFAYVLDELEFLFLPGLISGFPSATLGLAAYVLTALGLYAIASRRGIANAWMSWIPVLNIWIIGSLSDQYRYVVKGQYRSKRKILLVLEILKAVLGICCILVCVYMVFALLSGVMRYDHVPEQMVGSVLAAAGLGIPLAGVAVAALVIRYMAMYDIYVSCDPANSVLFLVLSIFFPFTEPFFLFFSRNRDGGMPPRKTPCAEPPLEGEVVY